MELVGISNNETKIFKIIDPYCQCGLDKKFGMPDGWDSTELWVDVVIILDTSEAMGDVALVDVG